jgi:hypothetical protein
MYGLGIGTLIFVVVFVVMALYTGPFALVLLLIPLAIGGLLTLRGAAARVELPTQTRPRDVPSTEEASARPGFNHSATEGRQGGTQEIAKPIARQGPAR